ncbi:MAG TPA: hypothetical protein VF398_11070 [bacterium]
MTLKLDTTIIRTTLISLFIGGIFWPAAAQISPGKLSTSHQTLEGMANCTKCHQLGAEVSDENCRGCHKAVAERIAAQKGYHASADVVTKTCSTCHREHNGREYDLVYWPQGQKKFAHALTGYRLEGAHEERDCRACHQPSFIRQGTFKSDESVRHERTFLGLSQDCLTCHADEHGAQLTDRCLDCHTYKAWAPAENFVHDRARYKLTGKHNETGCPKCHPSQPRPAPLPAGFLVKKAGQDSCAQYQGLAFENCSDCHKDTHQGRLGSNCVGCHTTDGFRMGMAGQAFDHNRTDYPLQGRHAQVECKRCHRSGIMTEPLAFGKCQDCHADVHLNQFTQRRDGVACEGCHTVEGFSPATYTLDSHQQCVYPLTGSHLAVPCNQCHVPVKHENGRQIASFDLKYKDCADCHKDVHQGQVNLWIEKGGCAYCHQTETWHRTSFDHSLARFTLDGKHREILCLKCHYIQVDGVGQQVWMKPLARDCAGCHADIHRGQFLKAGQETVACERCHKTAGWNDQLFFHNKDSQFALDGAHEKVACRECHKPTDINGHLAVLYRPLGTRCVDCHQQIEKAAQR